MILFFTNHNFNFIGAVKPLVTVLVKALPISQKIRAITLKYLNDNNFNTQLYEVPHKHCKHGQNIVGY